MAKPASLMDIIGSMEMQSDELQAWFDRQAGKCIELADEMSGFDETDEDRQLREAIESDEAGRFVQLPERFDINEHDMMARFIRQLPDAAAAKQLDTAIHGRGAFRRFKDEAQRLGVIDDWYAYRNAAYREIALQWCRDNGIDVVDDAGPLKR